MSALGKCPHCGHEYWDIESSRLEPITFYGICENCHATGPDKPNQKEAIAAWNRRYVCDDKDGKKVFAGDTVMHEESEYSVYWDTIDCSYSLKDAVTGWKFSLNPLLITLIESGK